MHFRRGCIQLFKLLKEKNSAFWSKRVFAVFNVIKYFDGCTFWEYYLLELPENLEILILSINF